MDDPRFWGRLAADGSFQAGDGDESSRKWLVEFPVKTAGKYKLEFLISVPVGSLMFEFHLVNGTEGWDITPDTPDATENEVVVRALYNNALTPHEWRFEAKYK